MPMASKFAQDLEQLLTRIQEEPLTLNDLLEETAEASFLLLIALLAAPFLIPVPPGFTTVPCLVSLLLSLQMVAGRRSPWLPDRLKRISFPQSIADPLLKLLERMSHILDNLTRPRLKVLLSHPLAWQLNGLFLTWLTLLLMSPLPFTNPLFSTNILVVTIAILEKDGLLLCVGYGLAIVTTLGLIGIGYLLWQAPQLLPF